MPFPRSVLRRALIPLALTVVIGLAPASGAIPSAEAAAPRFGMAAHLMWQSLAETRVDLDRMKAAGMTYVRFDVSWKNSEPVKGSFRYLDKLDAVIAEVQKRGMTLTMTVIETPGWANGGRDAFTPPKYSGDYGRFVGMLAKRYAARPGMVYEIWNEPNDQHFWTPGPNVVKYTQLLKTAWTFIRRADPDATVLAGSILYNDIKFLHGIYANGGGSSFNGLAIHPYALGYAPGSTANSYFSFKLSVPRFTKEMANHGQAKPIWITEMGWSSDRVSDSTRATYFKQAVAIAKTWTNVRGMAAYTVRQSQFAQYGLIRRDGTTTASWRAYDSVLP
jgi:polysaccharide biosynthesis protein PslG